MLVKKDTTVCNKEKVAYAHIYNTVSPDTLEDLLKVILRSVNWKVEKRGIDEILCYPDAEGTNLLEIQEQHATFAHRITEVLDAQPSGQVLLARSLVGYPEHPHTDVDPYTAPGYRYSFIPRESMNVRNGATAENYASQEEALRDESKIRPEQRFYQASMMYDTMENPGCEEGEKKRIEEWPLLNLYLRGISPDVLEGRLCDSATCPTAPVTPTWNFVNLPSAVSQELRLKYEIEGHRDTRNMDRSMLASFIEHNTFGARWAMFSNAQRWLKIDSISPDREAQVTFPPKLRTVINRLARSSAIRDVQMTVGRSYLTRVIRQWSWIIDEDPILKDILTASHGAEWCEQAYRRIEAAAACELTAWDNFCSSIYGPSSGGEDLAEKSFTVAMDIGGDSGIISQLSSQGLTGDAILRNTTIGDLRRDYWKVPVFMRLYFLACVAEGISMALLDIVGFNRTTTQNQIKPFLATSNLTDKELEALMDTHPDIQAKTKLEMDSLGMVNGQRDVLSLPRYHTLPIVHAGFACSESVEKPQDVTLKSLLYRAELVIPHITEADAEATAVRCRRPNSYITAGTVNGSESKVAIIFQDGQLDVRYRPLIIPIAGFRSRERAWVADLDPRKLMPAYGDFFEVEWIVYNITQLAYRFSAKVEVLKSSIDKFIELDSDGRPFADGLYNWSLAFDGPDHYLERTDEGVENARLFRNGGTYAVAMPRIEGVTYRDERQHLICIAPDAPHLEVPTRFECMRRNLRMRDDYYVTNGVQFEVDSPLFAYEERTNAWRGLEPFGSVFGYELFKKGAALEL